MIHFRWEKKLHSQADTWTKYKEKKKFCEGNPMNVSIIEISTLEAGRTGCFFTGIV